MIKLVPRKNLAVYTCVTGCYDVLLSPRQIEPKTDYICFTDQIKLRVPGWEIRILPPGLGSSAQANRFAKMHPHILLPEYDSSIYIDGNIEIIGGLHSLLESSLKCNNMALYEHPVRDCVYLEAKECAAIGYDWCWRIENQMNIYRRDRYPAFFGLFECGVIVRLHSENDVKELMEAWWLAYQNGIKRDQISLPYLAWRQGVQLKNIGKSDPRFGNKHFSLKLGHRRPAKLSTRARGFINRKLHLWFS